MELYKFGIRFRISNAAAKPLTDFIAVFQGWIQKQALAGHLLVDVHDYSHVPNGPGILLVAHEANLNIGETERSLVYIRKQPAALADTLAAAEAAAKLLTAEQGVQFQTGQFEVFANDRLLAPNTRASAAQWQSLVAQTTGGSVVQKINDPRERLTFVVTRRP